MMQYQDTALPSHIINCFDFMRSVSMSFSKKYAVVPICRGTNM